jgi:hypothetical protein
MPTGAKADDFFEGFFNDAQIEERASVMAAAVAKDLGVLVGVRAPLVIPPSDWLRPEWPYAPTPAAQTRVGITVNGRGMSVPAGEISYESVVKLAFPEIEPGFVFTMVCRGLRFSGSLIPGESVALEEGMIFSVADTSGA